MNASFNKIAVSVALVIGMAASTAAMAAEQASIKVIGTIKPGSCDISINGDAVLDYGDINSATLNANTFTDLATKTTKLNVDCTAPTLFGIRSTDIAEGANEGVGEVIGSSNLPNAWFSLGKTSAGKIIGGYRLTSSITTALVDNAKPDAFLLSATEGSSWTSDIGIQYFQTNALEILSWGIKDNKTPVVAQNVTLDLKIIPSIAPVNKLGSVDDVKLDGNATFDVVYL
ncbi:DUF1120 domain-containing protein [Serratia sp. T13T92]|uniref:DUF1120 domain-containing protein n=1 Tax=Serratia sp. T13T92 TaxID=3397496 RepID=UPI0003A59CFE